MFDSIHWSRWFCHRTHYQPCSILAFALWSAGTAIDANAQHASVKNTFLRKTFFLQAYIDGICISSLGWQSQIANAYIEGDVTERIFLCVIHRIPWNNIILTSRRGTLLFVKVWGSNRSFNLHTGSGLSDSLFGAGDCPMHYRVFHHLPGLSTAHGSSNSLSVLHSCKFVTIKNVPRVG